MAKEKGRRPSPPVQVESLARKQVAYDAITASGSVDFRRLRSNLKLVFEIAKVQGRRITVTHLGVPIGHIDGEVDRLEYMRALEGRRRHSTVQR